MELFDKDFERWIEEHSAESVHTLRLKYSKAEPVVKEAISQLEYRQKAGTKFGIHKLWFPSALSVEQATSARIAQFHASLIEPHSKVLDMTMGLGIDAATIAQKDDAQVTAIERDPRLCMFAELNYRHVKNLKIINADSVKWLTNSSETFDYIFIDPARRDEAGKRVYNIHDCTPDISQILPEMLCHAPQVFVKLSPMLDVTATITDLQHVAKVYVIEERGEVRELLVHIDKTVSVNADDVEIETVSDDNRFLFTKGEEREAGERYAEPHVGEYLYEPSPAIMKAAPFKLLGQRFDIDALHPNTHLYVSKKEVKDFTGKRYKIDAVIPYSSKFIKRFSREYPSASVSVRNFPITAAALRNKLKVKEGDTLKVFGVTIKGGTQVLLVAHRVG